MWRARLRCAALSAVVSVAGGEQRPVGGATPSPDWVAWPDATHLFNGSSSPPFSRSTDLVGFEYDRAGAITSGGLLDIGADTWYPSWASDGDLYSCFTDGIVSPGTPPKAGDPSSDSIDHHALSCGPCVRSPYPPAVQHNNGSYTTTGHARISGNNPRNLTVEDVGTFAASALPYQGRYPSANFVVDGVWYYGTYAIADYWGRSPRTHGPAGWNCGNWCILGPFVGFRHSTDGGKTWTEPRMEMARDFKTYTRESNLFRELGPVCDGDMVKTSIPHGPKVPYDWVCNGTWVGTKIKFGTPHMVDFGQNLEHSPDGRAYIIGDGANESWQPQSWNQGSQVYMARTKGRPTPSMVHDADGWEFYAGHGEPWASTVDGATALFTWENRTGSTTLTFVPGLSKFIMTINTETSANTEPNNWFDMYFLEADTIEGPYHLVTYLKDFGPAAYFAGLPSKFNEALPGVGFLSYSQWGELTRHGGSSPANSTYRWDVLPMRFTKL